MIEMRIESIIVATLFAVIASNSAYAQKRVEYHVSFPEVEHHEAEIEAHLFGASPGEVVEFRMSRTSPGRYALHEFAKNVYSVEIRDGAGNILDVTRPNPHQWNAVATDTELVFKYTLFADRAGGTYTGIDRTHAHLNIPATFIWARQFVEAPISVSFDLPDENWKVATQLAHSGTSDIFTAPNLYYFLDSPIEISAYSKRSWQVADGDEMRTINLVIHHDGTEEEVDSYTEMAKKVVAEQIAIYGDVPDYDYGEYTFLADYLPHVSGDGMEHRNSTYIVSTRPLSSGAVRNLGTLAHEYFHQWNVERIRPQDLEPFDFENANMTGELWFAEGFTSYYTGLSIRRTGINNDEDFARGLSGTVNTVVNSPGRQYFSAREMSMQAPFVDAAVSVDPTNRSNTFISYYTFGSAIGLGLDLTLRSEFDGITLDDYMAAMWKKFGVTEEPFTNDDLKNTLGELVGDQKFADRIFSRYIEGREAFDYARLLANAGFHVRKRNEGEIWTGARFADDDGAVVVSALTTKGSPFYNAGIEGGDTILRWGDTIITDTEQLDELLADSEPDSIVDVTYQQRGESLTSTVTLTEDPAIEVVTFEEADLTLTDAQLSFRELWLSSKVK